MQVCFYRHTLLNRGGDKMVVDYANYLQSRGHSVSILANEITTIYKPRVDVRRITKGSSKAHTILHALLKKLSADMIIADIIVTTLFLSLRNRKHLLYFAQDYDESYYKNPFMKLLIRTVYVLCLTYMRIPVIAVSEELGSLLKRRFNARVTVIANGIDPSIFYPDKDPDYLLLKKGRKVVLVFARRDHRKGFDISLKVLNAFKEEIESGSLAVWAVGEMFDSPLGMHKFGFVPPDTLRKILSCSDALLYPSRHEGMPLFVLEAMACGCPVVTTEAVQFARHGIDALKCRVADADALIEQLRRILSDDSYRRSIEENAFVTAEKYFLEKSSEMFENVLLNHGHL